MHEVLGVVVARKGSRRIKRKNIRLLGGIPLVAWTFEAVEKTKTLNRIVVSTDDEEVKTIAEGYEEVEVPFFPRPANISKDVDTSLVLRHCIQFLNRKDGYDPEWVVLLQPTSPFRTAEDIDACVNLAIKENRDTVVSLKKAMEYPEWMFGKHEERLRGATIRTTYYPSYPKYFVGESLVSQNLPESYYPNGAVYVTKTELIENGLIFGKNIQGYVMSPERSVDIETEFDLLVAETLLQNEVVKPA